MKRELFLAALIAGLAPATLCAAQAGQSAFARDRNVSVMERPRPDYDALGQHIGAFTVYPKATLDVTSDDNIYASETNEASDTIVNFRPSLEVESNWSRHQLTFNAAGQTYRYSDYSTENNTTYSLAAGGRLDVRRQSNLTAAVTFDHLVEPRGSANVARNVARPIEYDASGFTFGAAHEVNRLRFVGAVRVKSWSYDDTTDFAGVTIRQDFRDRTNSEVEGRADYAVSPALAVFVIATRNEREYDNAPRLGDVNRDSKGWEGAVGATFDASQLARGQFQVGYLTQEYDDASVGDVKGLGLRGKIEWFPTQLATITVDAERAVDDTGLIGSAGSLATRGSVRLDYEVLRNLILSGRINASHDDYRGVDREDDRVGALIGANYLLNRRVGLSAAYNYLKQESKGLTTIGQSFTDNRFQVGVTIQY